MPNSGLPNSGLHFVAGATGYVGQATVAALGARAVAHVRPDSPALGRWRGRFEASGAAVDATPWAEDAMAAALARALVRLAEDPAAAGRMVEADALRG